MVVVYGQRTFEIEVNYLFLLSLKYHKYNPGHVHHTEQNQSINRYNNIIDNVNIALTLLMIKELFHFLNVWLSAPP